MRPLSVKKSESVTCVGRLNGCGGKTVCCSSSPLRAVSRATSRPARLEPLQGEAGDFARVFQIEFVFDVCPVRFHGLWAEMQ